LTETNLYSAVTCIENAAEHKKIHSEAFHENGGALEPLLQLEEHMELKLCRWISPILENRIRGASPVGDIQRISMPKGCHNGSFII
jgi:hypothetical protein